MIANLKIGTKLTLLIGMLLCLMLASSVTTIYKLGQVGDELDGITNKNLPVLKIISKIEVLQLEQAVLFERMLKLGGVTPDDREFVDLEIIKTEEEIEHLSAEADKLILAAEKLLTNILNNDHNESESELSEFRRVLDQVKMINKEHVAYELHVAKVMELINAGRIPDAEELAQETHKDEEKLNRALLQLVQEIEKFNKEASASALESESNAFRFAIIMIVGSLIVGSFFGFIVTIGIVKPVKKVSKKITLMKEGDLTVEFRSKGTDEIGNMTSHLSDFAKNLHQTIVGVQLNSDTISSASTELSAASSQMSGAVTEMSGQAKDISAASTQLSGNIESVAAAATEMSQNMDSVGQGAENISTTAKQVAKEANNAVSVATEAQNQSEIASETMRNLGASASEIGDVTDMIKQIAEQTNLLALNANIEAASAGDAGKGFAVVANEIKDLAKQSAGAAEDIAKKIGGIQKQTTDSVKVIQAIAQVIIKISDVSKNINSLADEQSDLSMFMLGNINESSSAVEEVAKMVNEMSASATQTSASLTEFSQAVNDAAAGIGQVNSQADELANVAVVLKNMMDKFKVN